MRSIQILVLGLSLLGSASARAGGEYTLAEILGTRVGRFLMSETAEGRRILRFFNGRVSFRAADRELFLERLEAPGAEGFREQLEARLNVTLRRYERETFLDPMEMRRIPVAEQNRLMTISFRTLDSFRSYAIATSGRYRAITFTELVPGGPITTYSVNVEEFLGR